MKVHGSCSSATPAARSAGTRGALPDGLEIGCDNGERMRVAFALDCCDREALSCVATTSGITGEDVDDPPSSTGSDGSIACPSTSIC